MTISTTKSLGQYGARAGAGPASQISGTMSALVPVGSLGINICICQGHRHGESVAPSHGRAAAAAAATVMVDRQSELEGPRFSREV